MIKFGLPQIIYFGFSLFVLYLHFKNHGQKRVSKWNFHIELITVAIETVLLALGGFYVSQ